MPTRRVWLAAAPGLGEDAGFTPGRPRYQLPGGVFFLLSALLLATSSFHVYYSILSFSLDAEGKFGAVPDSSFKKEKGSLLE